MPEIALVDLGYDVSELEPPQAATELGAADSQKITRTFRVVDDPPPPPLKPHPSVLKSLQTIPVPEEKLNFGTKPRTIPHELVANMTSMNRERIPLLLQRLSKEAGTCEDTERFLQLVRGHADRINKLVAENRRSATSYCKGKKLTKKVQHDCKSVNLSKLVRVYLSPLPS